MPVKRDAIAARGGSSLAVMRVSAMRASGPSERRPVAVVLTVLDESSFSLGKKRVDNAGADRLSVKLQGEGREKA